MTRLIAACATCLCTILCACGGSSAVAARSPSPSHTSAPSAATSPSAVASTAGTGSCPTVVPAQSTASPSPPTSTFSTPNLIQNPGAEADKGAPDNNTIVNPTGWTVQAGQPTAIQYGASGGFPGASDPGPPDRGANFFAGGNVQCSELTQTIDLTSRAADIDANKVTFFLSAWLGGFSGQDDFALVDVIFPPATAAAYQLGPVTHTDRQDATSLVYRALTGAVPSGARSATILLQMTRFEGTYNDGYADNVSLQLSPAA